MHRKWLNIEDLANFLIDLSVIVPSPLPSTLIVEAFNSDQILKALNFTSICTPYVRLVLGIAVLRPKAVHQNYPLKIIY